MKRLIAIAAAGLLTASGSMTTRAEDRYGDADRATSTVGASAGENPFRAAGAAAAAKSKLATSVPEARKAQSDQALLDCRRALSVGDLARAQQFLSQVESLDVTYEGAGDSPARAQESVAAYREIESLRKTEPQGSAWREQYAKFLVAQSQALVSWKDLDTAARAAAEAQQLSPTARSGGATAGDLLRQIDGLRSGKTSTIAVNAAVSNGGGDSPKAQTTELLARSRAALKAGKLADAEKIAGQASAVGVPDSQFGPTEDSPSRLAADLARARMEAGDTKLAAGYATTATPDADDLVKAAGVQPPIGIALLPEDVESLPAASPLPAPRARSTAADMNAAAMLEAGEEALRTGDRAGALESFRQAYTQRDQLDLVSQQRLQGHLQMLAPANVAADRAEPVPAGELLDSAAEGQSVVARQLSAEIGKRQSEAAKLRENDPNKAVAMLGEARTMVEESELSEGLKNQLIRRIEMSLADTQRYIKEHKAEIELDAANRAVLDAIERERVVKVEVQQRTAEMVEQFNKLVDEQRYAEAEVIAKRAYDMSPDELVVQQMWSQAKMIRREMLSRDIRQQKENGFANILLDNERTAGEALANANTPFGYGPDWDKIKNRKALDVGQRNLKEIEIEQKLKTQVLPRYNETPLTTVVEGLSQLAGVNIHLDPRGLSQEGVQMDTPVTLNLPQEISLKSALKLILDPLHLTYSIEDEVLKITSEQIRDGTMKIRTYAVGDLVVPIPNFVPSNNIGLQGLINDAYASMGYGPQGALGGPVAMVAGARPGQPGASLPKNALAQQFGAVNPAGGAGGSGGMPFSTGGVGPGGAGGAASADFDSLIDLIVSTVENESWAENGTGEGEIQSFPTNLSLVISQTQRVHEQIADLLEQLRRLQDLQVTIEVRFIQLDDQFFERIGVDFDFDIQDRTGLDPTIFPNQNNNLQNPPDLAVSATVGMPGNQPGGTGQNPNFTVDLDLPYRQNSFGLATPTLATPADVGTFGFAILSEIEAYFVINASQGNRRSNTLQAPKVTLFNGQQAFVTDASFRPFVISVIPVVGEFAAAQQPVIVVLSEGTMMSVQAVVSDDRRYVRLTLVPFFSSIGEVRTFTFEGSETTSTSSANEQDEDGNDESTEESETISRSGTTVQLPTFQVISVNTTVSVPDGGTVLLGGIKRLSEQRNEFGVPLLSKVPYVDRLFRNVGISRTTNSLMMMVTPHIIIQEEEEERLGIESENGG